MIELGSGMGKPSLHWAALFNSLCIGIELQHELFLCSLLNTKKVYENAEKNKYPYPPVSFVNESIFDIQTLNGFNVAYSFDSLFEGNLIERIASLLSKSTVQILISYRSELEWLGYGLSVHQLETISMTMTGSNEKRTCSIFRLRPNLGSKGNELDQIDPLFRGVFQSHKQGLLVRQNQKIDISLSCGGGGMKTRSSK